MPEGSGAQLLAVRRISRAQVNLEWPEGDERLFERIDRQLSQDYPDGPEGSPLRPPFLAIRKGDNGRLAQLRPTNLSVSTEFTRNYELKLDLACDWIAKHWIDRLFDAFDKASPPVFVALIMELQMSTLGFELDEHEFIRKYVRVPPGFGKLADAEIRVCTEFDDRYFLNVGLSAYQTMEVQLVAQREPPRLISAENERLGSGRVQVAYSQSETDHGLMARVDVNTKVNIFRKRAPIQVDKKDGQRVLTILRDAVNSKVPELLSWNP